MSATDIDKAKLCFSVLEFILRASRVRIDEKGSAEGK
jgi:hypothetical protein